MDVEAAADAEEKTSSAAPANSTTLRVTTACDALIMGHKRPDEAKGAAVERVLRNQPTDTQITQHRAKIGAYIRTYLVADFDVTGDSDLSAGNALWDQITTLQHGDPDTVQPTGVVLDPGTLAAFAQGNRAVSQLLYAAPSDRARRICAPAMAVLQACAQVDKLAHYIADLDAEIEVSSFTLGTVLSLGRRLPYNAVSHIAHVMWESLPSATWPAGRPILTPVAKLYEQIKSPTLHLPGAPML